MDDIMARCDEMIEELNDEQEEERINWTEDIEEYLQWAEDNRMRVSQKHLTNKFAEDDKKKKENIRATISRMVRQRKWRAYHKGNIKYITLKAGMTGSKFADDSVVAKERLKADKIPYFPNDLWNTMIGGGLARGTQVGIMARNSWGKSNQVAEAVATLMKKHDGKFHILLLSTEESEAVYGMKMCEVLEKKFKMSEQDALKTITKWQDEETVVIKLIDEFESLDDKQVIEFIEEHGGFDLIVIDYADGDAPISFPEKIGKSPLVVQCKWLRRLAGSFNSKMRQAVVVTYIQPKVKNGVPQEEAQGDASGALFKCFHMYLFIKSASQLPGTNVWKSRWINKYSKKEYYNFPDDQLFDVTYDHSDKNTTSIETIVLDI